jgi:CBS domain-containing protein
MYTIRDLLEIKGDEVWSIEPEADAYEALQIMADKDIGSVLVIDDDRLLGIVTEKDFARRVVLRGKSSRETAVYEIMTRPVHTIHPDKNCRDALEIMTNARVSRLPVVEDGQVIGVISVRDVMKEVIYQQTETIRFWEDLSLER